MSSETPSIYPPQAAPVTGLKPGFGQALRGLWLFTWKSQLVWRRAPLLLFTILFIPVLALLTVDPIPPRQTNVEWIQRPEVQLPELMRRLPKGGLALPPEKQAQLLDGLQTEWNATHLTDATGAPLSVEEQIREIKAYEQRMIERAKKLLDFSTYLAFYKYQNERIQLAIERAREEAIRPVRPFYNWILNFYFLMVLPIYCLATCGAMIRDELQSDTLGFLVTRPVSRSQLFLAKFICQLAWIQIVLLLHTALLFSVGFHLGVPGLSRLFPLYLGIQIFAVFGWASLASLFGLFTKRYMVLGIVYGFIVELGLERIPTNVNSLSLTRHIKTMFSSNASIQNLYEWGSDQFRFTMGSWSPNPMAFAITAMAVMTLLFLFIATVLFTVREYNYGDEMQK